MPLSFVMLSITPNLRMYLKPDSVLRKLGEVRCLHPSKRGSNSSAGRDLYTAPSRATNMSSTNSLVASKAIVELVAVGVCSTWSLSKLVVNSTVSR